MCGIGGILTYNGSKPDEKALLAMKKALGHRGPDGQGLFITRGCGLVQTRLSIIDIEGGKQPLYEDIKNKENGAVLVANGEIYNDLEIRKNYKKDFFYTGSDCEPPIHLYKKHGIDFAEKLRGMYAIAIWDKDKLVLSRDAFGIKPLYYAFTNKGFVFASQPQAIIASGMIEANIHNFRAIELLELQFNTQIETIYENIKRLNPGETIIVKENQIKKSVIKEVIPNCETISYKNEQDAIDDFGKIFAESVQIHQRSDVPFGMFLSGGVDSSALLKQMQMINSSPVIAFTAGFSNTNVSDEREHAKMLAKSVGAEHINIDVTQEDFIKHLPQIIYSMDDPACDYAIIPTYLLAKKAKDYVTVVLSGEGGDEIFAGYGRYRAATRIFPFNKKMRRKGRFEHLDIFHDKHKTRCKKEWRRGVVLSEIEQRTYKRTKLQKNQAIDISNWLPNDLLTKLDRCLMAHQLEGRVPFLDDKLANFGFSLPDELKLKGKDGKYIVKKWLEQNFPQSKPFSKKKGFTVPVLEWLLQHSKKIGPMVAEQHGIADLCKKETVLELFSHPTKKNSFALWSLLFYAIWHQCHIENKSPQGDLFSTLDKAS